MATETFRMPPHPGASSVHVSNRMSVQRRKGTDPEVALRKLLHAAGARFNVNVRVPGLARRTIDVAFPRKRVAVFVDGCFWHGCPDHGTSPASNGDWWRTKIDTNQRRDASTNAHLRELGWRVVRVWEHDCPEPAAAQVLQAIGRGPAL